MAKNIKRGRGRPAFDAEGKTAIAKVLHSVAENAETGVSYYLSRKIIAEGYIVPEPVYTALRGKPRHIYKLTKKGQNLLNLSRFWKRKVEATMEPESVPVLMLTYQPQDNHVS